MLDAAQQLGWKVVGLEMDSAAVISARNKGLNVIEGSWQKIESMEDRFDCIICGHVLEHVYQPIELLTSLSNALKPGGLLILSLPNARSSVKEDFGKHWRGLEAPRHIAIPSLEVVIEKLKYLSFSEINQVENFTATYLGSKSIKERMQPKKTSSKLAHMIKREELNNYRNVDIIQILATKKNN